MTTPAPAQSVLEKLWNWIKGKAVIVEADLAEIIGVDEAAKLEAFGKNLLSTWVGPMAFAALADATDVVTGNMSVSKAITSLIALAIADGKKLSQAAALQVIALAQNALPAGSNPTVTPVA